MTSPHFSSCLAPYLNDFCELQRALDLDYTSPSQRLSYFDRFLSQQEFSSPYPDFATIDRYMQRFNHLKPATQATYLSSVRRFCIYLSQFQPNCPIPQRFRTPRSSEAFSPHIFTLKEIAELLQEARTIQCRDSLRGDTLATLFGLLFSTGLRIAEALALDVGDLHLDCHRLFVRKGKFRKQRWVPLSTTTTQALQRYLDCRRQRGSLYDHSPLFVNTFTRRLSYGVARKAFRQLLVQTGTYSGAGQPPRLHDLRHYAESTVMPSRMMKWGIPSVWLYGTRHNQSPLRKARRSSSGW